MQLRERKNRIGVYCLTGRDFSGKTTLLKKMQSKGKKIIGHSHDLLPKDHQWISELVSQVCPHTFITHTNAQEKCIFFTTIALAKINLAYTVAHRYKCTVLMDGYIYKWLAREWVRGTISDHAIQKLLPTLPKPDGLIIMNCKQPFTRPTAPSCLEYLASPDDFDHFQNQTLDKMMQMIQI
ncbi:MAG: hypothetical protein KDK51_03515 [Deltaproteobacteria bacterium]|nr:hypothetical protein [Deltaproteobacteria bacterium]